MFANHEGVKIKQLEASLLVTRSLLSTGPRLVVTDHYYL